MRRDAAGQATVELVLCLPFVALLLAVFVEVALLASDRARIWQAAREAARVAVVDPDPAAAAAAGRRVGPLPMDVEVAPAPHVRRQGEHLTVSVSHRSEGSVPLVGRLFSGIELTAEATMSIEVP